MTTCGRKSSLLQRVQALSLDLSVSRWIETQVLCTKQFHICEVCVPCNHCNLISFLQTSSQCTYSEIKVQVLSNVLFYLMWNVKHESFSFHLIYNLCQILQQTIRESDEVSPA